VAAHEAALLLGPGRAGIWDRNLILSAIGRPYSGYHRPLAHKAAALFQAVALNHGFVDGNKRTAVILTSLFIERSGYRLTPARRENINKAIDALAISVVDKETDRTAVCRIDPVVALIMACGSTKPVPTFDLMWI
jgi:death-on-curing protein